MLNILYVKYTIDFSIDSSLYAKEVQKCTYLYTFYNIFLEIYNFVIKYCVSLNKINFFSLFLWRRHIITLVLLRFIMRCRYIFINNILSNK